MRTQIHYKEERPPIPKKEMRLVTNEDTSSQTSSTESSCWDASDEDSASSQVADRRHPDIPDYVFHPGSKENQGSRHNIPIEDEDVQARTPQAELLAWHYRLGHLPFP